MRYQSRFYMLRVPSNSLVHVYSAEFIWATAWEVSTGLEIWLFINIQLYFKNMSIACKLFMTKCVLWNLSYLHIASHFHIVCIISKRITYFLHLKERLIAALFMKRVVLLSLRLIRLTDPVEFYTTLISTHLFLNGKHQGIRCSVQGPIC